MDNQQIKINEALKTIADCISVIEDNQVCASGYLVNALANDPDSTEKLIYCFCELGLSLPGVGGDKK